MDSLIDKTVITVITYNILSSNLAELMLKETPDVYKSDFMNDEYRWNLLSKYLTKQINNEENKNLVICLQEVSEDWLIKLATLFAKLNYKYVNVQYGRVFDGNMGVLIAYPNYLKILKSEFFTPGKHVRVIDDITSKASGKMNTAIMLILENPSLKIKFGVITYHMPCEPNFLQISLMHSKILYKKFIKFMEDIKWVFTGDMNILPDTITYKYLQSNCNCIWKDYLTYYPITNYSHIKGNTFNGCLDYIFYSKNNMSCKRVVFNGLDNIIPNSSEPSDHISIKAIFDI
jgi:mRNA deadenylase 3'-5' endonuclease subunit Ccr4